ncbi:cellobiose ABC transporter membrane protein [Thermomonospora echinospora]|uniref:Cellobiose ABC transporter membrane protein n=1 Tax=Thermomonospora echinospora TaxID=1992 RepID=A0A1H6E514_9ACTN|nr:carbohydrate ABC transporter permease [Thermomonospora echinospora]SEG92076.1 cellobiose ABC transporter membrane protein [Thermomonospora echinospora]
MIITGPRGRRRGGTVAALWGAGPLTRIMLAATIVLSMFPIYWMFVVATRTNDVVGSVPPPVVPGGELGGNLARLFGDEQARFTLGLVNSAIAASTVTVSTLLFASLAGFAFAKLRFRGRNAALLVMLATMMVPVQMGIIPLYMLMAEIGWTGRLQAVIVPFLVTGFGVFMMRQYTLQALPDELIEAARIDGCSTPRIYWSVVLPVLRPAMAVLGLFTFMQTWNEFIWPLAVLDPDNPTVQYSLNLLNGAYYTDYSLMFTGTAVATLPLLAIFLLFGRQLIGGIMDGALKA